MALRTHLALQIHHCIQQCISGLDCLGAGLEATLGDNHVGELLCQVNVGHFQGSGQQGALASDAGGADVCHAGVVGLHVGVLAGLLQTALVGEGGKGQLTDDAVGAVGVDTGDGTGGINLEVVQIAHGVAILIEGLGGALGSTLGDGVLLAADGSQIDVQCLAIGLLRHYEHR